MTFEEADEEEKMEVAGILDAAAVEEDTAMVAVVGVNATM